MESIQNYLSEISGNYGVNPIIFGLLYFGTIPFSLFAFWWLTRNVKKGKSIFLPVFLAFLSFIGTYLYLFWVGKNIPNWVYLIIVLMMIYSGKALYNKIRNR